MYVQFTSCVYGGGRFIKENEWYLAEAITTQTCFAKKSFVVLGKLTGKHLWWSLFSNFWSATLVKKILMNKPFSVNGCKHLWASASESNLRMSTILFLLLYIRYKGRVKRFIGVPLTFFYNFLYFLKWNLMCTFKCDIECLFMFTFYGTVLWTLCANKCTTMGIFEYNSIAT